MSTYAIEAYISEENAGCPPHDAHEVADAMSVEGYAISYVRALVLPADETCFHVLEAASVRDAALLAERAQLSHVRIVEATEWTPK